MPVVALNGINVNYEEYGSGPPVVFLHGFSGSIPNIRPQIPLSDKYRVVLYDARGHGGADSPPNLADYSEEAYVEDLRALLDHLDIDQAVLAGMSMGGFIAIAFYFAHPERVRALVLCGAGPGIRRPEQRDAWNADREKVARILDESGVQGYVEEYLKLPVTPERLAGRNAIGLAGAARNLMHFDDSRYIDRLEEITVPVLSLAGERDQAFLSTGQYIARKAPNAQYIQIADAGHPANQDQPEQFNAVVRAFLEGLPPA